MSRRSPPVRKAALLALLLAAGASIATSPATETFSVQGEARWSEQLGGEASSARQRFEVVVRHPELSSGTRINLSIAVERPSPPGQVVIRTLRPGGGVSEWIGSTQLLANLEESVTFEVETLAGAESVELRLDARFSRELDYVDNDPPPAPAWTASELQVELRPVASTEALNARLPPSTAPIRIEPESHDCPSPDAWRRRPDDLPLEARLEFPSGPVRPGTRFELVAEVLEGPFDVWFDGVEAPAERSTYLANRRGFVVPAVAGPVEVTVRGRVEVTVRGGADAALVENVVVEPGTANEVRTRPAGPWVAAASNPGEAVAWVASAAGEVVAYRRLIRQLPEGTRLRDLRWAGGIWAATSERIYRGRGAWLEPVVDADVSSIHSLGRRGYIAAGARSLLVSRDEGTSFHAVDLDFVALDVHVDLCGTGDVVALAESGGIYRAEQVDGPWVEVLTTTTSARWITRPANDPNVLLVTTSGPSLIVDLERGESVEGPVLHRLADSRQRGPWGAGPNGLWWYHGGRWRQVMSWLESQVIGLQDVPNRGLVVLTPTGEILLESE